MPLTFVPSSVGLIVGKFYPPHRGHSLLIDTALAQVGELHAIVCAKAGENPAGELRAMWLRESHPNARVHLIADHLDADDSRLWAEYCVRWLKRVPDVVFTSEEYGEPFAAHLGCRHVCVDKARRLAPVSGTAVRTNPFQYWDFLSPPVRAFYCKRVCLVGAESTGKTTLAANLAAYFQTVWVSEYGREYSEAKLSEIRPDVVPSYQWESAEFVHIARTQIAREDEAARRANKVLICDTDAFATSIWHHRYMNFNLPELEELVAPRRADLYLLCDADTPFVQDGLRDGELIRHQMHRVFEEELRRQNRPFQRLSGSWEKRLEEAITAVREVLS